MAHDPNVCPRLVYPLTEGTCPGMQTLSLQLRRQNSVVVFFVITYGWRLKNNVFNKIWQNVFLCHMDSDETRFNVTHSCDIHHCRLHLCLARSCSWDTMVRRREWTRRKIPEPCHVHSQKSSQVQEWADKWMRGLSVFPYKHPVVMNQHTGLHAA